MTVTRAIALAFVGSFLSGASNAHENACELFACAFLAFETSYEKPAGAVSAGPVQNGEFETASKLLEKGTAQALSILQGRNSPPPPSTPCLVFAGSVGEPMFKVGRAYEFEARRTLNIIREANIDSRTAFDRLKCTGLIGENP